MERLLDLLNFMAVLILSVAFHEGAHAWLADRFGDGTPRAHGRMTWNPFAHVHPIFTVALPAILYWTSHSYLFMAMTPVNPRNMRRPRLHAMLTSLGGPAASLLLGLVFFGILVAFAAVVGGNPPTPGQAKARDILILAVEINVFGAVFNMVPIPPLDGSAILEFVLPPAVRPLWGQLRANAWIVFGVLVVSGVMGKLLRPAMEATHLLVAVGLEVGKAIGSG